MKHHCRQNSLPETAIHIGSNVNCCSEIDGVLLIICNIQTEIKWYTRHAVIDWGYKLEGLNILFLLQCSPNLNDMLMDVPTVFIHQRRNFPHSCSRISEVLSNWLRLSISKVWKWLLKCWYWSWCLWYKLQHLLLLSLRGFTNAWLLDTPAHERGPVVLLDSKVWRLYKPSFLWTSELALAPAPPLVNSHSNQPDLP